MIVYLDSAFKCHSSDDGTMTAVETDFFNGKCKTFIEGYRFIPSGETWIREDGVVFTGEMLAPWKDHTILEAVQREYEQAQAQIAELEAYHAAMQEVISG